MAQARNFSRAAVRHVAYQRPASSDAAFRPAYPADLSASKYLKLRGAPQKPAELLQHSCVNWRRSGEAGLYKWRCINGDTPFELSVKGSLVVSDCAVALQSAVDGLGITIWIREWIKADLDSGQLVPLLEKWSTPFPSFYLYYPSSKQISSAL